MSLDKEKIDDISKIYKKINDILDTFILKYNISASSLDRYVRNNIDKFINSNSLNDIADIKKYIKDVLEHRIALHKDGVLDIKYEDFILIDEKMKIKMPINGLEYEKLIADYFNLSLSYVELADENNHLYKINDMGKEKNIVIYSKDDIKKIKKELVLNLYRIYFEKFIIIKGIEDIEFALPFSIGLVNIADADKLKNEIEKNITTKFLANYIKKNISNRLQVDIVRISKVKEYKGYYLWFIDLSNDIKIKL